MLHQLQVEISNAVVLIVLALEIDDVRIILPLQFERVVRSTNLENFTQRLHVHTQRRRTVAFEVDKCTFSKQKGNQGDMRAVHGLDLDPFFAAIKVDIFA